MKLESNSRVIISNPPELGGCVAVSQVRLGYQGTCAVNEKYTGEVLAVLPNSSEAENVAGFLSTVDGGKVSTFVVPTQDHALTHRTFEEWMRS